MADDVAEALAGLVEGLVIAVLVTLAAPVVFVSAFLFQLVVRGSGN